MAVAIVSFILYQIFDYAKYHYDIVAFWHSIPNSELFTPSALTGIDTLVVSGRIRDSDQIYRYIYNHDYYVMIWKIGSLKNVTLDSVAVNTNVYLDKVKLLGEILDSGREGETEVRFGRFFKGHIAIDLDEYSKVLSTFQGKDYRGFYGNVGKIAFEDGDGEIIAMENYTLRIMPTLFVMCKKQGSFYMIIINSKKPFGVDMLKILNLK